LQKPTSQLLATMQVNFYKLYTTYLVNIFATLNNLNLKMQDRAIIISLLFIAAAMFLKLH